MNRWKQFLSKWIFSGNQAQLFMGSPSHDHNSRWPTLTFPRPQLSIAYPHPPTTTILGGLPHPPTILDGSLMLMLYCTQLLVTHLPTSLRQLFTQLMMAMYTFVIHKFNVMGVCVVSRHFFQPITSVAALLIKIILSSPIREVL